MLVCLLTLAFAAIGWGGVSPSAFSGFRHTNFEKYCVSIQSSMDLPPGVEGCAITTSRQGCVFVIHVFHFLTVR